MQGTSLSYIGLGGNLPSAVGDASATVRWALAQLAVAHSSDWVLLRHSSLYGSKPVDATGPDFINAVACVQTTLSPLALLHKLQAIELAAGRQRPYRNAPRTLDLDLLLYGAVVMNSTELTLPHPRMAQRAFVLAPLAEIAPELVPASQLQAVQDQGVWRLA